MGSTTQNAIRVRFQELIAAFPKEKSETCIFSDYDAACELESRIYKTLYNARHSGSGATDEQHALTAFASSAFGAGPGSEPDIYANPAVLSFHLKNAAAVLNGQAPRDFMKACVERGFSSPQHSCASVLERVAGIGHEVIIEFDGSNGAGKITLTLNANGNDLDDDLADDIMALAPYLIHLELPDWKTGVGAEGRLRLFGPGDVFLDADDRNRNWIRECGLDLSMLSEYRFASGSIQSCEQSTPSMSS